MRLKTLMLAALPAVLLVPTMSATSSSAQYFSNSQPEMAETSALHAPQEAIKLPFLKVETTPIPKMSESSAVRMACGGSPIGIYRSSGLPFRATPTPAPAPATEAWGAPAPTPRPLPIHHAASVHGYRLAPANPQLNSAGPKSNTLPAVQAHPESAPRYAPPMPLTGIH